MNRPSADSNNPILSGTSVPQVAVFADRARWDQFVTANPAATLYHLWCWGEILHEALGHAPTRLAAVAGNELQGILPLTHVQSRLFGSSLISMPFLNYGGVVATTDLARERLYEQAIAIARDHQVSFLELRNTQPVTGTHPVKLEKATFIMPLTDDEETTMATLRKATRNRLRKMDEYNLEIRRGGMDILDDFYTGFSIAMKEHGTPVLPRQFFRSVITHFGDQAEFYVACQNGKIAGAKLTIVFRDTLYSIWGGYPKEFRNTLANYLLSWEAARQAIQKKIKFVDFGRSNIESGPADFKRHFGCQQYQLYWEYPYLPSGKLPALNPQNAKYQTAIAVWRKLPLGVTRLVGPYLSKKLP